MLKDVGDKEWTESLSRRQLANAVTTADLIDTDCSYLDHAAVTGNQALQEKPQHTQYLEPSPNRLTYFETED